MNRHRIGLVLLGVVMGGAGAAHAQRPENRGEAELAVSLVTIGPGDDFASSFGHAALVIEDRARGTFDWYDYGYFDFDQRWLAFKFLRGSLVYWMEKRDARREILYYTRHGRTVRIQTLDLLPDHRLELQRLLDENAKPEHREFRYDPGRDNCSTRIRDILDEAVGGAIQRQARAPSRITMREAGYRVAGENLVSSAAVSLLSGRKVDEPISEWDEMYLPYYVAENLARYRRDDGAPLVSKDQVFAPALAMASGRRPVQSMLFVGLAISLIVAVAAGISSGFHPRLAAVPAATWLTLAGLIGAVIAIAWFFGTGWYHESNENLLLFNPVMLVLALRAVRQPTSHRAANAAAWMLVLGCALALVLKWLPGAQQNLEFVALAAPPNLTVAWAMVRVAQRSNARAAAPAEVPTPATVPATAGAAL